MLFYFAALLAAAVILIISQPGKESNRWAAFFVGCASVGGLVDTAGALGWELAAFLLELANHTLTPYGVLIFCIVYSELFRTRARTILKFVLLLPVVLLAILFFAWGREIHYMPLLVFVAPYYLASCALLVAAFAKERDRRKKTNRLMTLFIIAPSLLAALLFINVGRAIDPAFSFFSYMAGFVGYSLLAGVLLAFLSGSGVLGVKLRLERDPLESAIEAVSSGTALLNHTIKNEIGKISLSADNIKSTLLRDERAEPGIPSAAVEEQLQIIANSAQHMLAMVMRIHGQTQEIVLLERPHRLGDIAETCVRHHMPMFAERGIFAQIVRKADPEVMCDAVHLQEVLGNLLRNAAEAIRPGAGGDIRIVLAPAKRGGVTVTVRDNGRGIPKRELDRVLEPFYTTKGRGGNFGLGLTYCYQVMQQSGGSLRIESAEGEGTAVSLHFPGSKVLSMHRPD